MTDQPCTKILKALADATRWSIVGELLREPLAMGEVAARLDVSAYNLSKHIRVLREAGIVATSRKGKNVMCAIAPALRRRFRAGEPVLDLGCCIFRFDQPVKLEKL